MFTNNDESSDQFQNEPEKSEVSQEQPVSRIKLGDEEFDEQTIREWREAHNMKGESTRRYQEASKLREQYSKYADLDEQLQKRPELFQKIQSIISEKGSNDFEYKLQTLENKIETREAYNQLEKSIGSLQNKYKTYFEKDPQLHIAIVKKASEMDIEPSFQNLEAIFKALTYDSQIANLNETARNTLQKSLQLKKGLVTPVGTASIKKGIDVKKMTNEEISQAMLNDPRW